MDIDQKILKILKQILASKIQHYITRIIYLDHVSYRNVSFFNIGENLSVLFTMKIIAIKRNK